MLVLRSWRSSLLLGLLMKYEQEGSSPKRNRLLKSGVTYFGQPVIRDLWLVLGSWRSSLGFSCVSPAPRHWRSVLLSELVSGVDRFTGLEDRVSCRVRDQSMSSTLRDLRFAAVMLKNSQLHLVPSTH